MSKTTVICGMALVTSLAVGGYLHRVLSSGGPIIASRSTQTSASPASAAVAQEVEEQRQQALRAANEILAKGQWGREERAAFHQQLGRLDPAQREQMMQKLVKGIDDGTISVNMPHVML
jgi:hypothetical protein